MKEHKITDSVCIKTHCNQLNKEGKCKIEERKKEGKIK